jgi:hypothetical protein
MLQNFTRILPAAENPQMEVECQSWLSVRPLPRPVYFAQLSLAIRTQCNFWGSNNMHYYITKAYVAMLLFPWQ